LIAALVFGALHLPNPFLAPVTCLAALALVLHVRSAPEPAAAGALARDPERS